MERPQERFARQLYDEITRQITSAKRGAQLSIEGAGVNWRVSISLLERISMVHCFAIRDEDPEFLTIFRASGDEVATARTSSMRDTVSAISRWLDGDDLPSLYNSFAFVDHWKRRLLGIRESILQCAPSLDNGSELKYWGSGIYYLWFRYKTRSAQISYYGKNEAPDASCQWDDCELFRFHAVDAQFLANVLKRWLCDDTKPSDMRKEFPALSIGKLADYYEAGNPIEGEFTDSWDHIEQFYDQVRFPPKARVFELIKRLREAGYDRTLRAGQSMFTFIVSRSRRHGLHPEQSRINFEFQSEHEMRVSLKIGDIQGTFVTAIAVSDPLITSLDQLVARPID
jgi:hypothetical protein